MAIALARPMAEATPPVSAPSFKRRDSGHTKPPAALKTWNLGVLLTGAFLVGALVTALVVRLSSTPGDTAAAPKAGPPGAAAGPAPPKPRADDEKSRWSGSTRSGWARDGSRTVSFEVAANHDIGVWMKRTRPLLVVRCMYKRTEVFVAPGSAAKLEDGDLRTVRVRYDDEPDATERWEDSRDSQQLFAPDGVAMARRLAKARTLRLGFTPFNAAPVAAEFEVSGFDKLIGVVAKTCGWKP